MKNFLALFIFCLLSSFNLYAQDHCQRHYDRLDDLRARMRIGYDEPLGNKLRQMERDIKEDIRLCRKSTKTKSIKSFTNQLKTKNSNKISNYGANSDQLGNQPLVIKGKFQGKKQQAWLAHFTPNKECLSPKTLGQFSKCLQERDEKAEKFSASWDKQNISPIVTPTVPKKIELSQKTKLAPSKDLQMNACQYWTGLAKKHPEDLNIQKFKKMKC